MRDFLTEFYNKVVNFFQAEKIDGENTKETAKNRLKLVLMQDRSNLEPETMSKLREELIEVISKYIVIDKDALGLNLDGDGESMALMLNIPVIRAKTPEEIEEALAEANAAKENTDDAEAAEETEEEETVVEFSEGSIEEILPCECDGNCKCMTEGESCSCESDCTDEQAETETLESNEVSEEVTSTDEEDTSNETTQADEEPQEETSEPKKRNKKK